MSLPELFSIKSHMLVWRVQEANLYMEVNERKHSTRSHGNKKFSKALKHRASCEFHMLPFARSTIWHVKHIREKLYIDALNEPTQCRKKKKKKYKH